MVKTDLEAAESVGRILIRIPKRFGAAVFIGTPCLKVPVKRINRTQGQTEYTSRRSNILNGSLGEIVSKIQQQVSQLSCRPAIRFVWGAMRSQVEAFQAISVALVQAIVLTYMLLAALLGSYLYPFYDYADSPLGIRGCGAVNVDFWSYY